MIDPNEDGITHINIYSKGKTEMGRLLSNFAHTPFETQDDGKFESIEGYWYWLGCNEDLLGVKEKLRTATGFAAKKLGRELQTNFGKKLEPHFQLKIMDALEAKLWGNPKITYMLMNSDLPFFHYYVFADKVIEVPGDSWILEHWEFMRSSLKKNITTVSPRDANQILEMLGEESIRESDEFMKDIMKAVARDE